MDAARKLALKAPHTAPAAQRKDPLLASLALLLALFLAEAIYVPLASPRFALRAVEIRGDERVGRQVAANIHLKPNTNMLRAPLALIEKQARSCPAVKEARVQRAFPDRVIVTIERREPIAVIRRSDATLLIDADGKPFTVAEEWGWGLPELVGPHLAVGAINSKAAASEIDDLLAVLQALGPDPRLRVTRLQLGREGGVELTLDSGTLVEMGSATDLGAKARLLVASIEQIGIERIKRLDLSAPQSAYWEPRDGHS
ncbi:MAG: cell division protein FtsQ/DivIB [Armatimonadota bacterium]